MKPLRTLSLPWSFGLILVGLTVLSDRPIAYVLNGSVWVPGTMPYTVNPSNLDVPASAIAPALAVGANAWRAQSNASFSFTYAGESTQTTNTNDGINLVLFRNASSGSAIATAYWWSSGSRIIDGDIVFWDGAYRFFTGASGCSSGFYVEDIATHEFGHVLGLGHSALPAATMFATTASCNTSNRTLDADDIAGVRALYPPTGPTPPRPPTGVTFVR